MSRRVNVPRSNGADLDLPPEPGAESSPFADEPNELEELEDARSPDDGDTPAEPPTLRIVSPPPALRVTESRINVVGTAEVAWAKGKMPGVAAVRVMVRAEIADGVAASDLEDVLPGAYQQFEHRGDSGSHAQRSSFEDPMRWLIHEQGDIGDVGIPVSAEAPIGSLTVTGGSGVCTLTISVKFQAPIRDLPRIDGLSGRAVRIAADSLQEPLPL